MSQTVTVLSIDGGGVRGLLAASVLHDLIRRVRFLTAKAGRPSTRNRRAAAVEPSALFDLMAGTSTGALIVLGLTKPQPLDTRAMVEVYRTCAARIFPPGRFAALRQVRQAFAGKYDSEPYEAFLHELFGDVKLSDCNGNLLIAGYDIEGRKPFLFRKGPGVDESYPDFLVRDVARATTAAPTFFEPACIGDLDGTLHTVTDGGLVANNPALLAYVEARRIYPNARRFVIVSLGTGRSTQRFSYEAVRRWGYLDWVSPGRGVPLVAMMFDGQSRSVAEALTRLPQVEYHRINCDLDQVSEDIDDASEANIDAIASLAKQLVHTYREQLHQVALTLYKQRVLHRKLLLNARAPAAGDDRNRVDVGDLPSVSPDDFGR